MARLSAREFIREHDLCKGIERVSGIYAITINGRIVYIGQARNMESRTRGHIRNMINGYKTPKYGLLLAAWNRRYRVDCQEIERCPEEQLDRLEKAYIDAGYRPLNRTMTNSSRNPKDLPLDELLTFAESRVRGKRILRGKAK